MIIRMATILMLLLLGTTSAYAISAEEALKESRVLAASQKYDRALVLLEKAEKQYPKDVEIKLAIIRNLSWKGQYDAAQKRLTALGRVANTNADAQLLGANLAFYRGDYTAAEATYRKILLEHPEYTDAKAGLERVLKAKAAPPSPTPTEAVSYRWQLDAGYEHSSFSRVPQAAWNQEFLQITRFLDDRTAVHGKITRYDQFTNIDTEYEAGVDHRFADYLIAYAYGAISPEADFRPKRRIAGGGTVRLLNAQDVWAPVWFTLDTRYDMYDSVKVLDINPGLRVDVWDGWSIAARKISVDANNAKRVYGEDYRLDGTIIDGLRFYAGYADAPETEAAVTVDTKTRYGGIAWDMNEQMTLRVGYSRDDRENSYKREVINASVSTRF